MQKLKTEKNLSLEISEACNFLHFTQELEIILLLDI